MQNLPVSIRLNPAKASRPFEGSPIPWSPHGLLLEQRSIFTLDPLFHAGCYYVQDSSAMFVGHVFRQILEKCRRPGLRVLDLCAAPGGKSTDLAASLRESIGNDYLLVSNEVMQQRARILGDNLAIWGDPCVMLTSADAAVIGRNEGYFDIIVVDAPCSGEGMFRKDEKAVHDFSQQTVQLCAARQKRILADVWPSLKEGGWLIYSTCTYQQAENDDNLQWAAEELGGEILPCSNEFAEYGVQLSSCGYLLKAGESLGEGQWVGALQKTAPAKQCKQLQLKALRYGVHKGEIKGGKLVPDSDYALSLAYENEYPAIEVSREQALGFLHHDALRFDDAPLGYNVITYLGHPLGFVNNLGRRCNNLHPVQRRILMDIK